MSQELEIESRCIHLQEDDKSARYGSVSYPIYQTATFAHPGLGQSTGYDYCRVQNPTREHLEKVVAGLEHGTDAIAFSSGMAAITTVLELFKCGDHIVADRDLYGGTTRLFQAIGEKNGLEFTYIDFSTTDVRQYIKPNTKAFFVETPTNPMMNITDIAAVSGVAKENKITLIVDNTFMSPYLQNPLDLGADIVIHSGTKYLSGHNDTIAGFAVVKDDELSEKIRYIVKTMGSNLTPFDSWLLLRGIQTLAIRMDRAQENALTLANWLSEQKGIVAKVVYPGLESHPGHELQKKQARGFGAMITFDVDSFERVEQVLNHIKVIQYAESLGGTESLLTYPITQTHADVPKEELEKNGITDRTLRLSVGIENVKDLIADLNRALYGKP